MKQLLLIIFIMFNLWTIRAFAESIVKAGVTQSQVDNYILDGNANEKWSPSFKLQENHGLAIIYVLRGVLATANIDDRATTAYRARNILYSASWWAKELAPQELAVYRDEIKRLCDIALERFVTKHSLRDSLVQILETLDLWSYTNWWFFKSARKAARFLRQHAARIHSLLPQLSDAERAEFAAALRKIEPLRETQLAMLYEVAPLTEFELATWFKKTAERFEKRLNAKRIYFSQRGQKAEAKEDNFFRAITPRLLQQYKDGEPRVVSAFKKAKAYFTRRNRTEELKFFARVEDFAISNFESLEQISCERRLLGELQ